MFRPRFPHLPGELQAFLELTGVDQDVREICAHDARVRVSLDSLACDDQRFVKLALEGQRVRQSVQDVCVIGRDRQCLAKNALGAIPIVKTQLIPRLGRTNLRQIGIEFERT